MNLQHLKYFVVLARVKNYAAAADQLHITEPSLSYAISQLEEELGVPLFFKSGRKNVLTSFGERFLGYADASLRIIENGIEDIQAASGNQIIIRVGFLKCLGARYIPELIKNFNKAHPEYNVKFNLEIGSTKSLMDGLASGYYDVVFCSPIGHAREVGTVIGEQRMSLIVPAGHPLACRNEVTLEETFPYPYIYYVEGSGMWNVLEREYPELHTNLTIKFEVVEEEVVRGFVTSGFGIGIVPSMLSLPKDEITRISIRPKLKREIFMLPTESKEISPALSAFYRYVKTHPNLYASVHGF